MGESATWRSMFKTLPPHKYPLACGAQEGVRPQEPLHTQAQKDIMVDKLRQIFDIGMGWEGLVVDYFLD